MSPRFGQGPGPATDIKPEEVGQDGPSKATYTNSEAQTDVELMILKICEIFLDELQTVVKSMGLNKRAQQDTVEKMTFMVGRIVSRAQRGLLALGLASATITASPRKGATSFIDMHAYSSGQKEPAKRSWHFSTSNSC